MLGSATYHVITIHGVFGILSNSNFHLISAVPTSSLSRCTLQLDSIRKFIFKLFFLPRTALCCVAENFGMEPAPATLTLKSDLFSRNDSLPETVIGSRLPRPRTSKTPVFL